MEPLATDIDVIERLRGRTLTAGETESLDALLVDASATVRRGAGGQIISRATSTMRLPVKSGRVRLPQRPVVSVTAVTDIAGNPLVHSWDGLDMVTVQSNVDSWSAEPWRNGIRAVDVTFVHGYDPVPDEVIGVVCSVVLRALGRPVDGGATQSETIAGYSYTVGVIGAAGPMGLLPAEREILAPYGRVVGSVIVGPS